MGEKPPKKRTFCLGPLSKDDTLLWSWATVDRSICICSSLQMWCLASVWLALLTAFLRSLMSCKNKRTHALLLYLQFHTGVVCEAKGCLQNVNRSGSGRNNISKLGGRSLQRFSTFCPRRRSVLQITHKITILATGSKITFTWKKASNDQSETRPASSRKRKGSCVCFHSWTKEF